jgi:hypothetical protein
MDDGEFLLLSAWDRRERAAVPESSREHSLVSALETARACVVHHLPRGSDPPSRDLLGACSTLGRLICERQGSASLATTTLDHLAAVAPSDSCWVTQARAILMEAYVAEANLCVLIEAESRLSEPWIELGQGAFGVLAPRFANGRDDARTLWSEQTAVALSKKGAKRIVAQGDLASLRALKEAASAIGLAVDSNIPNVTFGRRFWPFR